MAAIPLLDRHCQRDTTRLTAEAVRQLMPQLHEDWAADDEAQLIRRSFGFKNYYQTIAFVNALAWVAHLSSKITT